MGILDEILTGVSAILDITINAQNDALDKEYSMCIFLWYLSKNPLPIMEDTEYPHYLQHAYGIQKASSYHKNLLKEGYLAKSTNNERLNAMKVSELKNILEQFNLSQTGKKSILIQRIIDSVPEEKLIKCFTQEIYSLSDKGKLFLNEHDDCIKLYQHSYLEIEYTEYVLERKDGLDFYDTVWKILNKRIAQGSHDLGRHEYIKMYQILDEEGKREAAMNILLRILYIDLSGKSDFTMFAPRIVEEIANHGSVFTERMIDNLYQWKIHRKVCNKKLFTEFVQNIINGIFDEETAKQKLKRGK